jgi:uncharacterized damage-inducible protein DinB
MSLQTACCGILSQLTDLVSQISEQDFNKPVSAFGNATIGQHLRHTLEFFMCLEQGIEKGTVNYDKRAHNKLMERDKFIALAELARINDIITRQQGDAPLKLEVGYDLNSDEWITLETNYWRELVYNIEHAVHHMAIMKIGINEAAPYLKLSPNFGVAASTIRYHREEESASANR